MHIATAGRSAAPAAFLFTAKVFSDKSCVTDTLKLVALLILLLHF